MNAQVTRRWELPSGMALRILVIACAEIAAGVAAATRQPLLVPVVLLLVAGAAIVVARQHGALVLAVFLFSLPLFGAYLAFNPESQVSLLKDAMLGLAIVASVIDRGAMKRLVSSWTLADTLLVGLAALYLAALPTAPSLVQGLFGFKVTFWYLTVYFLARMHAPTFLEGDRYILVGVVSFAALVLWEILSATVLFPALPLQGAGGRILWTPQLRVRFSPEVMPVALACVFGLWLALFNARARWRWLGAALFVAGASVVLFSSLRTAFVAIAAGTIVVALGYFRSAHSRAAVLLFSAALLLTGSIAAVQVGLFDEGAPLQLRTLESRLDELNEQLLPDVLSSPLGLGAGTVAGTQGTLGFKDLTSPDADRVFFHSSYLSLALELGWLPALIFLVSGIVLVGRSFARAGRGDPASRVSLLSAALMLCFLVAGIANPALYQFPLNAIAWFWAGLGASVSRTKS